MEGFLSRYKSSNNYLNVFIIGIVTALLIFLPFIIYDKGLFLYYGDFDVQQIPFYQLAHDAIRSGATGWNWNTDLGVNFIGSYSFYLLGSPFFWLTLPFPTAAVPYLMAPLLILKFGLTAVTGYAFISRFTKYRRTAVLGGLLYAFCGFNVYNIFFNHFNEVVMAFPLLLIALDELVINNRRGGFVLAVALCAVMNYYFFFGQVFFVIIYFIIRSFDKSYPITLRKFFVIAGEAILGLLMSAVLLLPAIMAILGNTRLGSTLNGYDLLVYSKPQRYGLILQSLLFPPDIPARPNFFPDAEAKWSSVAAFLPLLSISAVVAFFRGTAREKVSHWAKRLLIVSAIIAFIPGLNAIFSAMNYSYYARWFYMPLLIMAMVSMVALERYNEHMPFGLKVNGALVAAFLVIGILPKEEDGKLKFFSLVEYPERFWAYVIIAVAGILLTTLLVIMTRKHKRYMLLALTGICGISIVYSTMMIYTGKSAGTGYEMVAQRAIYGAEKMTLPPVSDQFYRIDTYDELDNLGMHWGIPTINAFHSVVPPSIMSYYESIGGERGVASRPKPSMIGVRALNSVKYAFSDQNKHSVPMTGFEYYTTQNGFDIFENKYYIPMGFTYNYILRETQLGACPKEYKDKLLLEGLLLSDDDRERFKDILPEYKVELSYAELLSDDTYLASCERLRENAGYEFVVNNEGFTSKIVLDKQNFVFYSVPYDDGWTATVNGAPAEIIKVQNGFMAVLAPGGNNVIRFEYTTPGLAAGFIITIVSAAILALYLLAVWLLRKKGYLPQYDRYAHLRLIDNPVHLIASDAYIGKAVESKEINSTEENDRK